MFFSNTQYQHVIKSCLFPISTAMFLWGCAENPDFDFPPTCPKITVLSSASDYYQFADNKANLANLINQASIQGVKGSCIDNSANVSNKSKKKKNKSYQNKIDTTMYVFIQAQRGPSADKQHYQFPYFIATLHNGEVVAKRNLVADINFPNNIDQVAIKSDKLFFKIPATEARVPDGYEFAIGFQLTPEQLEYNRTHFKPVKYTGN